ncbi:hypothetical protein ElyMa_003731900 [Elysia marginata]|uniref:Uncharacterized protein n=1 Tax=Elysia marginata TaxID=1093978 RepID=A0AAV4F5U4_9GAST|nr:hypothetical protein ElyMa_003731900 [Elysia marginata]
MVKWEDLERQREIAEVGGWALFVSNHSFKTLRAALACLPGPTGLAKASEGEGASAAGQKTVAGADWCSSLMVLPLLPASPNQCKHSVHMHTPTHYNPASTSRLS